MRVRSFAQSPRTFLTLLINVFPGPFDPPSATSGSSGRRLCRGAAMHSRYAKCAAASCFPPFSYPLSAWPLYGTCGLPAIQIGPCLAALIFGQLGSVYMSVKPHQCWAVEDEFGRINTGPSYMQTSSPVFATKEGRKKMSFRPLTRGLKQTSYWMGRRKEKN